jgi:hypothetical protein
MAKRPKRAKPVAYELIEAAGDVGKPMYELLTSIVATHHEDELGRTHARIALAWALNWKTDVDGRLVLGRCKKASDLDRELAPFDFVILLNRWFWQDVRVTDDQRRALLDHELMHAAVAYDERGGVKRDERGRVVFRTRKHDLEEFSDIVSRHGVWKRDIEAFAHALRRAEARVSGAWVGITTLYETLREALGVGVDVDVIATWPESERREVMTWALLRKDDGVRGFANLAMSQTMPACLAAVVRPDANAH